MHHYLPILVLAGCSDECLSSLVSVRQGVFGIVNDSNVDQVSRPIEGAEIGIFLPGEKPPLSAAHATTLTSDRGFYEFELGSRDYNLCYIAAEECVGIHIDEAATIRYDVVTVGLGAQVWGEIECDE